LPSAGTPVIKATIPPSLVFWQPSLLLWTEAVTRLRPSIMTIFDCSGANGALFAGSVNEVVVAVAAGRHRSIGDP
jgi:hypothetical protein